MTTKYLRLLIRRSLSSSLLGTLVCDNGASIPSGGIEFRRLYDCQTAFTDEQPATHIPAQHKWVISVLDANCLGVMSP
jgi:hypothetical protein